MGFLPDIAVAELRGVCEDNPSPVRVTGIYEVWPRWIVEYQAPRWLNGELFWLVSAPIKSVEVPPPAEFHLYAARREWTAECADIIIADNEPAIWLDTIPGERHQWLATRFPEPVN